MKVLGVAGWKNSGKTRLVESLVKEFSSRGYAVSTIKHAHHGFDIDHAGTDSHRHRTAGAQEVLVSSARRWALMHEVADREASLDELLAKMSPVDLVIVEGFKAAPHAKIETRRTNSVGEMLAPSDSSVIAVAVDKAGTELAVPEFDLDDIGGISDFVIRELRIDLPAGKQQ